MKYTLHQIDTGLDIVDVVEVDIMPGKFAWEPMRNVLLSPALKWLEREGMKLAFDKSQKRHVQLIAKEGAMHARMARDRFRAIVKSWKRSKTNPPPKAFYKEIYSATKNGFMAGAAYARLSVVDAEKDALSGSKSRQAAHRTERKPRAGSIRDRLYTIPKWWTLSNSNLLCQLKPHFPQSKPENILRQIIRIKKMRH